jgi:isoquinoline 1-oxidoreductase
MSTNDDRVTVNGDHHDLGATLDVSLLEWLRDELHLTGAKYACGEAQCGACSVLVDGALTRACATPATEALGRSVVTIEGLPEGGELHAVQQAFVDAAAMQCGFCTPGMVIAASALLAADPHPTREAIVRWMQPNLCRCGAYSRIVEAIGSAAPRPVGATDAVGLVPPACPTRPRRPWNLVEPSDRDYFEVLGDGLVVIALAPEGSPTQGAWLHVGPSGRVLVFTGKVEVGQGTRRALRIAAANELQVSVDVIELVMGDTDVCPFDMGTFGSMGMPNASRDVRRAATAAREFLERDGPVGPGDRHVEVVAADAALGPTIGWTSRGPDDRREHVAAVTGTKLFASDLQRAGMLEGAVLRPPAVGARLRRADVSAAQAMPGVTVVVEDGFVGVAAASGALARAAVQAIVAQWERDDTVDEADLESHLRAHPVETEGRGGRFEQAAGDVNQSSGAALSVEATYTTPYVAHAPMETRVAVAEWEGNHLTAWTGTQQPFGTRRALAEAFGLGEERVRVVVPDTGCGFGGKHDPETALAASRLSRRAGAPVRVQWTREEEFSSAYFRPAAVIDVRASATSDGDLRAWDFTDINAGAPGVAVPYHVPNRRLRFQPSASPLPQGAYRALAATANNFARESTIDELAHALRLDPFTFRLQNLRDERLAAVARAAATQFGWGTVGPEPGLGAGIAIGVEKNGRVATCALVRVDGKRLEIVRIVTAFDCGAVIDPDNLRNQIEGATVMGIGNALFEAVHFAGGHVRNPRFSEYRVPRFADVPPIEVVLVDRADLPPAGGGETPIIAIAPAIANAIFAATGRRYRSLPLLRDGRLPAAADYTEPTNLRPKTGRRPVQRRMFGGG